MKWHDALARIVDAIPVDEATRHDLHAAVNEHYADDIEGLTDEEKSMRRAPVDRLSGTVPALFVGGLTQEQFDNLIEKAAERLNAKRNSAAKSPDAIAAGDAQTAQIAAAQQPSTTAQTPVSAEVPQADMTADEVASFRAWQAANKKPPADVPPASSGQPA